MGFQSERPDIRMIESLSASVAPGSIFRQRVPNERNSIVAAQIPNQPEDLGIKVGSIGALSVFSPAVKSTSGDFYDFAKAPKRILFAHLIN